MHKLHETVTFDVNLITYVIKRIHINSENFTFHLTFAYSQNEFIKRIVTERMIYFNQKIQTD